MPAIKLPPDAPRIELVMPEPWRPRVRMLISAMPARWCVDPRFRKMPVRVVQTFGALCLFTSVNGICYPTQRLICAVTGFDKADVSRDLKLLEDMGYITRVLSKSQRTHHAIRRHVKYQGWDEKPPPREIPGDDASVPWPFRGRDRKKTITTTTMKGDEDMNQSAAPEIRSDPERERRQQEDAVRERALFEGARRVAQYFADRRGRAAGEAVAPSYSEPTAKKWLRLGFTEAEVRQHIDRRISEWLADGLAREKFPYTLADVRFGAPQRAA